MFRSHVLLLFLWVFFFFFLFYQIYLKKFNYLLVMPKTRKSYIFLYFSQNAMLSQTQKGKNYALKVTAPHSKHYKQKAKQDRFFPKKLAERLSKIKISPEHTLVHAKRYNDRNSKSQENHRLGTVSKTYYRGERGGAWIDFTWPQPSPLVLLLFYYEKVRCIYSLESPHQCDFN